MFTLHIDAIRHYQCKPRAGWDELHSSFWSTEVYRVPVLCILGATPTGQKACVHVHGLFPFLLVPLNETKADDNYLHTFAARLEDAINAAAGLSTCNTHHVFSISLFFGRLKTEDKEIQQYLKVCFYDPDIVPRAEQLMQDGAVMNTCFQAWGAHIPFFLQFVVDHHMHDVSHMHFSSFKFRPLHKKHNGLPVSRPTVEGADDYPTASSGMASGAQWRSLNELLSVTGQSHCDTCTGAAFSLHHHVDNMPSEVLSSAPQESQSLCELEVDVKAADIVHMHQLCDCEATEGSDSLAGSIGDEGSLIGLPRCAVHRKDCQHLVTVSAPQFSSSHIQRDAIGRHIEPFSVDSEDDCAMDDSDCEENDEEDDSDGDIPQLDGTSDEKAATKKPSKKRASAKNSKLGSKSGGSGREDSSSQGEGSNPSCSPQVQSPVMVPGGDTPLPREQGVMSPYRHQQGSFPYQAGYYRQQWGDSAMGSGIPSMAPYPGYHPGWGQSVPPHGAYPFMNRFPGNTFGYYQYPRQHPYNSSFRQNGAASSRQQSNFSPPVGSPMSPPSYSSSGPTVHPHSNSQQYASFMSAQTAAMRRHSDGSMAQPDRQFTSSTDWQYPAPAFNNWGFAQSMPPGAVQGIPTGPMQGMPSGVGQSMPSGTAQSMPSGTSQSIPSGTVQSMPSGTAPSMSPGAAQGMLSGSVQSVSSGSAMPSGSVQSVSSESATTSGSVQTVSSRSILTAGSVQTMSFGSDMPSGLVQSMPSETVMSSGPVQNVSSGSSVPLGPGLSMSSGSDMTTKIQPEGPVNITSSRPAESVPLEPSHSEPPQSLGSMPTESPQSVPPRSEQSMSPGCVQTGFSGSAQTVPSGSLQSDPKNSIHGVSSGSVHKTSPASTFGMTQDCILQSNQSMPLESSEAMSSKPVLNTLQGPTSGMSSELFEGISSESAQIMSQDLPSSSFQATPAVSDSSPSLGTSVSTSSGVPAAASQGKKVDASSSGSSASELPGSSQNMASEKSQTSPGITAVSSPCVQPNVTASNSSSMNSSLAASVSSSVGFPSVSFQNRLTGSVDEPTNATHAATLQSSSISLGSSTVSSQYTHSGPNPSVSSRLSYPVPAFQDMPTNWWSSQFPGGPRPMQSSTARFLGQGQFGQMHCPVQSNYQMAGGQSQLSTVPNNQTPSGQRQPNSMSSLQNPLAQGQKCGGQNVADSTAHGQPFPMQHHTQSLAGQRYPGPPQNVHGSMGQRYSHPAQNVHSAFGQRHPVPPGNMPMPVGQRPPGPVPDSGHSQSEQGQNSGHPFSSNRDRRQSQIVPGAAPPSQGPVNRDRSRWQECGKPPSTLQDLLSAPDSSTASPSPHCPSAGPSYPRRAMSMDCSPSDFYTSPTRVPEGSEASRQEFKQPQKRSGSFSSPLGFSAGGCVPSALSNLYNFVSNVDPMARIPTPTSRTSTPSSTPHSDPSPIPSHRPEEDSGPMEVGLGPVKWQPHLPSPHAPPPCSTSMEDVFGNNATPRPPEAAPITGTSVTTELESDKPQIKQETELPEIKEKDFKKESTADAEVVMCNKEVSCDNLDMSVFIADCKGVKKESGKRNRVGSVGKKESSATIASSSGSSAASERLGKQSRMKKLGLNVNSARRMSDDRVNSPPVTPTPCAAYTFTFHVPTPVYKRFKMHAIFPKKASQDVKLVRMHPMDARRYSLMKIGRELVRLRRLSPQALPTKREATLATCTSDTGSSRDEHNSLIDPHTGELLGPFPNVKGEGGQTRVQTSGQNEWTEQSSHLKEPHCKPAPKMMAEGSCQTTSPCSGVRQIDEVDIEQKMHRISPAPITTTTSNMQTEMGDNSNQSWQAMDRDRRPSVKVEYPAQRAVTGSSEQWPGSQPPAHSWVGGVWGYPNSGPAQWGEQWQNTGQPQAWNPSHGGQGYSYGPWMGREAGFQQPAASGMYPYNTWSPSVHSFMSQPSVSTPSTTTDSSPSADQGGMGPAGQGQAYPQGYLHYSSGMYNQQTTFPPSSGHPTSTGATKFTPQAGSSMGAEHFLYHGQNYNQGMGHGPYPGNYSGYQAGRKEMCQSGFGMSQQQQQLGGGMASGLQQENRPCRQYGNPSSFEAGGGYSVAGRAPTLPSVPPHGPGPGPAQFGGGKTAHMYPSPSQQGPFMPPPSGQFFQAHHQFSRQSAGQFSPVSQANTGPPAQSGQAAYTSGDQLGHAGNPPPCPVLSDATRSQGLSCSNSRQQEQFCEPVNQQGQYSETPDLQDNKSENESGCSDSSIRGQDLHTPEQHSFLQQVACRASTMKVCEPSAHYAQNPQSDRPETSTSENSTDNSALSTAVQSTNSGGNYTKHKESKRRRFDDDLNSAALHNADGKSDVRNQKKSPNKCVLKGKVASNAYSDKQQQRNTITPCSRQNVRRSSVQLWSDGDSDSGEENSDDNEESSDDYQPSCRSRRRGQKRRSSRHQSQTEGKRKKRSSVNYNAHAFSKYMDHGFEKKSSYRLRQSNNQKERKRKDDSLIEGVHYIVVGKFKGHRVMLVKVDRVKVKLNEIVKVSDWPRTEGRKQLAKRSRLQGPRCRRIAKGAPPDDPCFVHTAENVDSEVGRCESGNSTLEEKSISLTLASDSNHRIISASCVKREEVCDFKKAIKLEPDQTPFVVHVKVDVSVSHKHSDIRSEQFDETGKGMVFTAENENVNSTGEHIKTEMEFSLQKEKADDSKEPSYRTKPSDSSAQALQVESIETDDSNTERKQGVGTPTCAQTSEKREQQDDSSERQDHSACGLQSASSVEKPEVVTESAEGFTDSSCVLTDARTCDTQPAVQRQSPMLTENEQPMKRVSSTVSLSVLEGKTC